MPQGQIQHTPMHSPMTHPQFFPQGVRRYGDVLMSVSAEVIPQLKQFFSWAQQSAVRWRLLQNDVLPPAWYQVLIQDFETHHKPSLSTLGALHLLYENDRMVLLPKILQYIATCQQKATSVYIYSAGVFSAQDVNTLNSTLERMMGTPIISYYNHDAHVIGGAVVIWNGFMIDTSLNPLLTHLKSELP